MPTTTPNLGLTKPTVGADADAWGGQLNASLDTLDAKVLDKTTGGSISGAVNVIAATTAPAVRITQTGTGEALRVEDEANPDASPFVIDAAGNVGVGGAASASRAIYVQSTGLTGSTQSGVFSNVTGSSAATSNIDAFRGTAASAAAAFTVANMSGLRITDGTKGAGSTITSLRGVLIDDQTQGTNNYGIESQVSSGANKWNIYVSGTAANYFAGNVGIGTTNPTKKFHIAAADGNSAILLERTNAGIASLGQVGFRTVNGIVAGVDATAVADSNNGALRFWTTGGSPQNDVTGLTERARITSAGYFKASNTGVYNAITGLGERSATLEYYFQSNNNSSTVIVGNSNTGSGVVNFHSWLNAGATGAHFAGVTNNVTTYQINANGSGGQVSDANLKTDIVEATPKLADLNRVRIVNYRWKEESGIGDRKEIGVIAQELEQVFPGLVDTVEREDGTEQKMVRYSVFVPMLIKAVQELSAQNAALESRLAALEQK